MAQPSQAEGSNSFRRIIVRSVLLPILPIVALLLVFLLQLANLVSAAQLVDHTDQVLTVTYKAQSLMVDMETGLRGYLITADKQFLDPYQLGEESINGVFDQLGGLISDNPTQTNRLAELRARFTTWDTYSEQLLTLRDGGGDYASLDLQRHGKDLFDAIRASVSSFSGEEVSLRSARNQAVQNGTQLVTVLSFASALMVSIIIAIFVRGELRRLTNTYSRTLQYVSQQAAQISADREWFRAIFASIGDAVVVTNTARKVTFVNRVAESLIGAAAPEGQPLSAILDIRHETNGRPIDDPLMAIQTMSDRLSLTNHLLLARPAQPDLPIELAASPLQNTKGAFDGVVLVFRDITARLGIQRNLEASEARYRELADAMPLIVWTTTADGTTDYYSRGWYDFTGQSPADFSSASWQPILHPDDLTRCLEIWTVSLQTGQRFEMEYRWRGADGDYRWFLGRAVAVTDAHGSIQRWIGTGTDIDAQKRAEEKLSALTEALEDRNVELDQFAYVTSHDLKAPLRGIANLSQWIEEDLGANATPEIHEQMALLQGRVHRMEALIDGILQYSRIGRVKIPVETVDVAALLSEIIDLLPLPDGFQIVVTPGMPTLSTERILLQQVFANLINNAIKHHHEAASGRITVSCTALRRVYEFVVADNGPGIAPIYHEKIFAIFQTLQSRDKVEGSGLGLSLVKKIVETHGGEIKVDSQEGAGAKFRFTWPKVPSRAGGD